MEQILARYNLSAEMQAKLYVRVIEIIRMQHAIQIYTQVRVAYFYVKFIREPQQNTI